jgi:exosortase
MTAEADSDARSRMIVAAAVAALGWFLCRQLSVEWRINPQYSYGWVVPFLGVYLFAERWRTRPSAAQAHRSFAFLFLVLLIFLLPLRVVQEANPDWRLVLWVAGFVVIGIFWVGLAAIGGRSWLRHFGFATAFILLAVPWPTPVENALVQSLMRAVAALAVETLNWMGIAAQSEGNLIRLAQGTLGVDEACSGVRSFQATIMAGLFFGELYRLTLRKRANLLIISAALALALNFSRALCLAVIASRNGIGAVQHWHDPLGYVVLAMTFFGLLALGRILRKPIAPPEAAVLLIPKLPVRGAIVVIAWIVICEAVTASWYGFHERSEPRQARWQVDWPGEVSRVNIDENVRLILRFNDGKAAVWNRADGSRWHLFFFSWKPGRAAANLARSHRPEVCLPSTGFQFVGARGVENIRAGSLELPIERLEFVKNGQRLHVYYCLWEDRRATDGGGPQLLTRANRLRAVLEGRRHLGQRVLEVVIEGIDSPQRADEEFAKQMPNWIQPLP